jgi:hypothetical protein
MSTAESVLISQLFLGLIGVFLVIELRKVRKTVESIKRK